MHVVEINNVTNVDESQQPLPQTDWIVIIVLAQVSFYV